MKNRAMHASIEEIIPMTNACLRNGLRMNPHDAPTSFMVLMRNRREKMVSLTVLLISPNEMNVKSAASTSRMIVNLLMPLFMDSTRSGWYATSLISGFSFRRVAMASRLSLLV